MSCNTNTTQDPALQFNGDIAGLGVRLSFYLQNFILVLLVDRSYEDAENALWTFIATSFGLTIAALAQVGKLGMSNLTLLEGILASQLAWLANIGTFLALASYSRSKGKDNVVKFAAVLQGYFSMILTIVMWIYADTFQLPQDRTAIKFVLLFGLELPALESGRVVALVFSSLTIVVYTCVTITEFRVVWHKHGKSAMRKREREHDLEMTTKTADRSRRGSGGSGHFSRHERGPSGSSRARQSLSRTAWLGVEVDPIFFGILVAQVIVFTYFIATTELIIQRSHACQSDTVQWGFGQVLALTVVIPSLIALYRAIHKNRIARPHKDKANKVDDKSHTPDRRPSITGYLSADPPGSPQRSHQNPGLRLQPSTSLTLNGERPVSPRPTVDGASSTHSLSANQSVR